MFGAEFPGLVRRGTEIFAGARAFAKHANHVLREHLHVALKTGNDEGFSARLERLRWDDVTEVVACASEARRGDRVGIFGDLE